MKNVYKTTKISNQNVVSFTCSDDALGSVLEILNEMKVLGNVGASRDIIIKWGGKNDICIFFDGDGRYKVDNISINGMTEADWKKEWKRLS